ncbi:MAG: hypothetical protein H5T61_13655 [Thermoflexales bacterium]|nr:hypothetical protein [Thermoflexales bacterium]
MIAGLRKPSPHFQRAVHVRYDLNNPDILAMYVPTPRTADALERVLRALTPDAHQRAFLLHGPYGSGKSLLVTILAAVLSRDIPQEMLSPVLARLQEIAPETAGLVQQQLSDGPRLLPVVLYGDEGDLASALLRALFAALRRIGWEDIRLATHYRAALETLHLWQESYPETYNRLCILLQQENWSIERLTQGLQRADEQAYEVFQRLYPTLTAGATFNHYGHSVIETYQEAIQALAQNGQYRGIALLWDEFGRFLEARAGDAFGREAALLQELAEFANHSQETPLYLVLVTHKALGGYVWSAPPEHIQEWRRIGERFLTLDVTGDPLVAYRLTAAALTTPDEAAWREYLATRRPALARMQAQTVEQRLFPELNEGQIQHWIVEGAYPLHPLTVYCLPRLSNKVAQNERTLFTFLTADEPLTLPDLLNRFYPHTTGEWIGPEALYDYFAEAMRADTGPGGVYPVWAAAEHALRKATPEETLNRRVIKTLAVLQAIDENPTAKTLAFALQADTEQIEQALSTLVRRKVVRQRRLDRSWELMPGSDVDLEEAIRQALERRPPSPLQLRRLLEQTVPPPVYQARQHNIRTGMTRFFWSWYRYPEEVAPVDWEAVLKGMDYADGLVIYLLARNPAEWTQAKSFAKSTAQRVVFVVPSRPLTDVENLTRELAALLDLKNDPTFREQDPRVLEELDFFIEDTTARLKRSLAPLIDPWQGAAEWYWQGQCYTISTPGQAARLLSRICDTVFPCTPELHNDLLNRRNPTAQQIRAAEQVIDALLTRPPSEQLGITGFGPDWLILHTILRVPGILRQDENGNWVIGEPTQPALASVWKAMEAFWERARQSPQPLTQLLDTLQSPPFGLRLGVLPLLLAAALREHLSVAIIRRNGKAIFPITGALLTDICRSPQAYTLELGPEDERLRRFWATLEERFCDHLSPEERGYPPLQLISTGMTRWLRSLPRIAQTTRRLSPEALRFRQLLETLPKDPAPALFEQLPALLGKSWSDGEPEAIADRIDALKGELEAAYLDLLRRVERFVVEQFAPDVTPPPTGALEALRHWAHRLEKQAGRPLDTLRLGDMRAQALVDFARDASNPDTFLDRLARRLGNIAPRDWNDTGEEHFYRTLREARAAAEQEIVGLAATDENILEVQIQTDQRTSVHRFRRVPLSETGQRILRNFKSTLETTGRMLSTDEKRQLVLLLLEHVLGREDDLPG